MTSELTAEGPACEFVSRSEITVAVGAMAALERAFADRARLVDRRACFLGLELLRRHPGLDDLHVFGGALEQFDVVVKAGAS